MSNSDRRGRRAPPVDVIGRVAIATVIASATDLATAIERIDDIEYVSPGSRATCNGGAPCNRLDLYLPDGGIGPDVPVLTCSPARGDVSAT